MKILAILPASIGGRLTMQSIFDGFELNGAKILIFDKLKDDELILQNICDKNKFDFIVGYDFAGLKIKIDNGLNIKSINYFSDVIEDNHSGNYWEKYYKYLQETDNFTFYWDQELFLQKKSEIKNIFYQPHFVNTNVYKNFNDSPEFDIMFAGRVDTDFRLNVLLDLMQTFEDKKFAWYAIERHFLDAKKRTKSLEQIKLLEKNYKGFISSEKDMAFAINNAKVFFNFNAQGISSLNYRTFQVMACERILLSDKRAEAYDLFKPNEDIILYEDVDDLKSKIDFFLKNNKIYKKIAKASRNAILANHSSAICVKKMLENVNQNLLTK